MRWRKGPKCKCSNHEEQTREPRPYWDSELRARIKIDLFHIHRKRDTHPMLRLHTDSVTNTSTGSRHWITSSISMRCHLSTDNIQPKAEHSIVWRNLIVTSIHRRLFPIFFLNFTNELSHAVTFSAEKLHQLLTDSALRDPGGLNFSQSDRKPLSNAQP